MPQLIPFFFLNQVVSNLSILIILVYLLSFYILPKIMRINRTRCHINSL